MGNHIFCITGMEKYISPWHLSMTMPRDLGFGGQEKPGMYPIVPFFFFFFKKKKKKKKKIKKSKNQCQTARIASLVTVTDMDIGCIDMMNYLR